METAIKTKLVNLANTKLAAVIDDDQVPEDMVFNLLNDRFIMGVCPEKDGKTPCRLFRRGKENVYYSMTTLSLDHKAIGEEACITGYYYE